MVDYTVQAELEWRSNVPAVIREMVQGFEKINRLIGDTKTALGELNGKGIASLTRSLAKLSIPTAALDGLKEMTTATRGLVDMQTDLARETAATARAYREMAEAANKFRVPHTSAPGGRSGGSHTSAMDFAMAGQMAGDSGMGLLERGFGAYSEVQQQRITMGSDPHVTSDVMAKLDALIGTLQRQYPGLTQAGAQSVFQNTLGLFPNSADALAAMPGAIRLEQMYEFAGKGRGGAATQAQAAEKAGDILGQFVNEKTGKIDEQLYTKWMNFQAKSYLVGGNLVDAKSWLAVARSSRTAGMGLSDRAMEEMQSLLELSPSRTGTALMSAFQVFGSSTAHMTNKNKGEWNKAGLLGKNGDIIDRQRYQVDPFQWVWTDMLPRLAAQGIKTRDQVLTWLTKNGQRGTVSGLLADIVALRPQITQTADRVDRQDTNVIDKLVNSDVGKIAALYAAEKNFFVALGKFGEGPGIALLTNLTKGLNSLTDWANAHPDAATRLITIGGGLALLSKVAGDTAMAALFVGGPLVRGIGGLGSALIPFASGGRAAGALAALSATSGAGSLFGLAGGIIAIGAAMVALPPLMNWLLKSGDKARYFSPSGGGGKGGRWENDWAHLDPSMRAWGTGESWQHKFWNGAPAAPGANSRRSGSGSSAPVQLNNTTIVNLDSKLIQSSVTSKIVNGLTSQAGPTGGDYRAVATPPGAVGAGAQ